MIDKECFAFKAMSLSGVSPQVCSVSAASPWIQFLGPKDLGIEGGEFDGCINPKERYQFEKTPTFWTIIVKDGKDNYPFKSKAPFISATALFQTKLAARFNINQGSTQPRGLKLTVAFTAKAILQNQDWYVPKGAQLYVDQHSKFYLDVDLKNPIDTYQNLTVRAKKNIVALFKKEGVVGETQPKAGTKPKPVQTPVNKDVEAVTKEPIAATEIAKPNNIRLLPDVDVKATRDQKKVKATIKLIAYNTDREDSYIVSPAPTKVSEVGVANNLMHNKKMPITDSNYRVYEVDVESELARIRPETVILKTELDNQAMYIQTRKADISLNNWELEDPTRDYAALPAMNFPLCGAESTKFYVWLASAINNHGAFTTLKQPSIRKGIVFDIVASGIERDKAKAEIKGFARRVYEYLKYWLDMELKVKTEFAPTKARFSVQLPDLDATHIESAHMMAKAPPELNSPMYYVEGQPQSAVTVQRIDIAKGELTVIPARRPGFEESGKWLPKTITFQQLKLIVHR